MHPDEYLGHWGTDYAEPPAVGFDSIEVLHFLKGKRWGVIPLNYIHALRPSRIRVTTGEVTCDCCGWRVTVYLDPFEKIERIEQEVRVGLAGNFENAADLRRGLEDAI